MSPKSALTNLPERNPFFTGRERVLAELEEALAARRWAALSGLGGVGKTQTAVEYVHEHLAEYGHAFWVNADSREALVSGYVTIAALLKLPAADTQDQLLALDAVKRWLTSHGDWLLILDNADDLALLRTFLPSGKNGNVLLTTRARATGTMARRVEIQEMGTEEGALFLLRRANYIAGDAPLSAAAEAYQATAKEIATELDGLPLALDQAAAYIEETECGLLGYLNLYQSHALELLQRRGSLSSGHPDPVVTTWSLSFEKIDEANPAAAELLQFCAFLHPDGIPEEVFREGAPELGPVLAPVASNSLAWNDALAEVLKYSMLRRDPNTSTLEIHRLVQAVLKQAMDAAAQRLLAKRAVRAVDRAFPFPEFSNWAGCERLLSQAQACAELINQWAFDFPEGARLLNAAGFYLYERSRYTDAKFLYERSLAIREKALGPEHPDMAQSLNNLAALYYNQGQYANAEPLYQQALGILEKALGPEHPDVAIGLNNLAALYRAQGQYAKAETLYERALAILEKALGPEHPNVAQSFNNLAELYLAQGRHAKAEPLFELALAIREKALGPEHPNVATSLNNLALLYYGRNQYAKAEPLYELALAIRQKALGPEHSSVANSLNNLAELYLAQGQHAKAEPLFERALAIREKALGPEHPDVAQSLNNLAALYHNQGQYAKAEPFYKRALAILGKALGPEHPNVATCLENLRDVDRSKEAEPLEARPRATRAKKPGRNESCPCGSGKKYKKCCGA